MIGAFIFLRVYRGVSPPLAGSVESDWFLKCRRVSCRLASVWRLAMGSGTPKSTRMRRHSGFENASIEESLPWPHLSRRSFWAWPERICVMSSFAFIHARLRRFARAIDLLLSALMMALQRCHGVSCSSTTIFFTMQPVQPGTPSCSGRQPCSPSSASIGFA